MTSLPGVPISLADAIKRCRAYAEQVERERQEYREAEAALYDDELDVEKDIVVILAGKNPKRYKLVLIEDEESTEGGLADE